MEWDNNFSLLRFNIDIILPNIDDNFDRVHFRMLSIINDLRSRKLTLEGLTIISKGLTIVQYTYIATIINLRESQINKAQSAIDNYIMNI